MNRPHPQDENSPKRSIRRITLRDVAKASGVSHATVSLALKGNSRISKTTTDAVLKKAQELGYSPDPMLSALAQYREIARNKSTQASLAWINTWQNPNDFRKINEFDLYWKGATETAERRGYKLEEFRTADLPLQRISKILKTRNIQGVLLPPVGDSTLEFNQFPWDDFAIVRIGRSCPELKAHTVTSNQIKNTILAFDHALALGYKRIGFVCEFWRTRLFSIGFSWAQKSVPFDQQLPALNFAQDHTREQQQKTFHEWLLKTKPDAILADSSQVPLMLKQLGYRIPEDIGLMTTSIHDTPMNSGIDQNPKEIGRAAVRSLITLVAELSYGPTQAHSELLIEGTWIEGTMLPKRSVCK